MPPNEELSKSLLPILALRERRAKKSFANMDISSTKRYLIGFQNISSFAFASSLNVVSPDGNPDDKDTPAVTWVVFPSIKDAATPVYAALRSMWWAPC